MGLVEQVLVEAGWGGEDAALAVREVAAAMRAVLLSRAQPGVEAKVTLPGLGRFEWKERACRWCWQWTQDGIPKAVALMEGGGGVMRRLVIQMQKDLRHERALRLKAEKRAENVRSWWEGRCRGLEADRDRFAALARKAGAKV